LHSYGVRGNVLLWLKTSLRAIYPIIGIDVMIPWSVCLSVCLSVTCNVLKRQKISIWFLLRTTCYLQKNMAFRAKIKVAFWLIEC